MKIKENINETVGHLFRQESGKMVAVLVKVFGLERLELIEDVVQDSLIKALEIWKFNGIPDNPKGWIYKAARNKAIDIIRKGKFNLPLDYSGTENSIPTTQSVVDDKIGKLWEEHSIKDEFLAMIYACCEPELSEENQISFILKSLCGFSTKEIARAFLTNEDTISKRIFRTKEYFRKNNKRPSIPGPNEIAAKTDDVLKVIYLIFNEGYNSTHSEKVIREDIIVQALFLCKSLLENPLSQLPNAYALMALMCFHSSRTNSRISSEGELILLAFQNRSQWNKGLIIRGNDYLNKAAFGNKISVYHLEAAIAFEHCTSSSYKKTNWEKILEYYNLLTKMSSSPIVSLNRSIVILQLLGAEKALQEIESIQGEKVFHTYYLFYALLGEIYLRQGDKSKANDAFKKAIDLTHLKQEKEFLLKKINSVI